jgi:DNA-binding response OmpR family regulator
LALDGQEALDFTQTTRYDVMVLDVLLPKIDGLVLCRRLRAAGVVTPILLLTARDAVRDRIDGLDSGADDYLTKPFALGELLARVRALLRRDATHKSGVLRCGELVLDPATRQARWQHRQLDLTAHDYRLLETLLRRCGWVVPREAIIESVWGFEYPGSSNLVEVYMRRLRRKLAEAGAPPLIHTNRGLGYRLSDSER